MIFLGCLTIPANLAAEDAKGYFSRTRIAGSYLSQSPYDYGFFWIKYY